MSVIVVSALMAVFALAVEPAVDIPPNIGEIIAALAVQLPIVAVLLFAVYKDWLRSGPRVDRERIFLVDLWHEERDARRTLEAKLDVLTETLKEATDVVERSVELNERIINDFVRPTGTHTRSNDRRD